MKRPWMLSALLAALLVAAVGSGCGDSGNATDSGTVVDSGHPDAGADGG